MSLFARVARGLILAMVLGLAAPVAAIAQEPGVPVDGEESEGKPLFGYLAAGAGCLAIMFVVSLSARR